jgi:RNA polymerase sigma-70 factor (ECF subfamily)
MLSELEDCVPDTDVPEAEDGEITEALNRFLTGQDAVTRVLFIRRYVMGETTEALAKRFGMKENTVSARLYRARLRLRAFLLKEGIRI